MHRNYDNDLLLRTLRGEKVARPPVWLMRQAGRILPQYRALRKRVSGFRELVETPRLTAEVTIQPVDELGVDAAILFSDILVIPDAMGVTYRMVKGKGPVFDDPLRDPSAVSDLLKGSKAADQLQYVYKGIKETVARLDGRVPLIGFVGAPWTLMAYMIEGEGSKTFSHARRWLYKYPEAAHRLLDKITDTAIDYAKKKVEAGVEVIQIFDSWIGLLHDELFKEFILPRVEKMYHKLKENTFVIYFPKNAPFALPHVQSMEFMSISLDWTMKPSDARNILGRGRILQGNLDPAVLYADPEFIHLKTRNMLEAFGPLHIANLGHGVYPDLPLEGVRAFVQSVQSHTYH